MKQDIPPAPGPSVDMKAPPSADRSSAPKLPNERDQASEATSNQASEVVKQGARDVQRGLQDTSRGDESNDAYQKQK